MENWRRYTELPTINENLTPLALKISPSFESQGTFSRLKNRFIGKKGDQSIDQETGKSKLKEEHPGHQFQFFAVYDTPGNSNQVEKVGPPIDYAGRYKGTISSEDDIRKLWNFALKDDKRFSDRLVKLAREMTNDWGQGKWKIKYAYAHPNELIDASVAFRGTFDLDYAQAAIEKAGK